MRALVFRLARGFRLALVAAALACGGRLAQPSAGNAPGWFGAGDRTDGEGSTFVCQGQGATEAEAVTTAQGVCTDKVCRLCGVEVESVAQATEALQGVSMQRKVIERCRQLRAAPLQIARKSTDCGPSGCSAWLEVSFSKAAEEAECTAYASEHSADSAACERLIQGFRSTKGRTAASMRTRTRLLDEALVACADIDVRPTPLLDALHTKLLAGMAFPYSDVREEPGAPYIAGTYYKSRTQMIEHLRSTDVHLGGAWGLSQQVGEARTLVGRIQLVRDYVYNRGLALDVIEAGMAADLDSHAGIARLLAALEAAPPGVQYDTADVHFFPLLLLREVHEDVNPINRFYRKHYPPETLDWRDGIPLAGLFAKDRHVDDADWSYIFELHRAHPCVVCVQQLLDVAEHGGPRWREERFFAALNLDLKRASGADERKRCVTDLMPSDTQLVLHLRPLLPADLQEALGWDFVARRVREADDADDVALLQKLVPLLAATLAPAQGGVSEAYCIGLADRLAVLAKRDASLEPLERPICACLTGPLSQEGTRQLVNKSDLYDYALARGLSCVRPI